MYIIYLAGNSLGNKDWIEKVKSKFDMFSDGEILYYNHWFNGNKFVDLKTESVNLAELVNSKTDYYVFAKSVGTILALKTIYEKIFNPKRAIFCGHPYPLAMELGLPINDYLRLLSIPSIFIQNELDPYCSYDQIEKVLKENSPVDYHLVKNANANVETHDYEDYEKLIAITKSFFQ